jgi:hypothetical protein
MRERVAGIYPFSYSLEKNCGGARDERLGTTLTSGENRSDSLVEVSKSVEVCGAAVRLLACCLVSLCATACCRVRAQPRSLRSFLVRWGGSTRHTSNSRS